MKLAATNSFIRNYVEIDLRKIRENIMEIRRTVSEQCKILFVLKANAYGHGSVACARDAENFVDWFAVASFEEAKELREAGIVKGILVFGPVDDSCFSYCSRHDITLTVFSNIYASHLIDYCSRNQLEINIHIEIDTGLNRLGFRYRGPESNETLHFLHSLVSNQFLRVTGIYTHFSCADTNDSDCRAFTEQQFRYFTSVCSDLQLSNKNNVIRHCCSSGGIIFHPDKHLDMVRTGMLPLGQLPLSLMDCKGYSPVLRWFGTIIDVKILPKNETISYNRSFQIKTSKKIITVSIGYGDGYHRAFSNKTKAIYRGHYLQQVGNIGMDMCMFDATEVEKVIIGERIIVLGEINDKSIHVRELANLINGVNGEVTASISARVPRVFINEKAVQEKCGQGDAI